MSEVLVTGGSSALGQLVVDRLVSDGHRVRVLMRAATASPWTADSNVDVVLGDLGDAASLRTAVDAVDSVVHCASNPRASQEVDVQGTARLVEAARDARNPHLVYVSIVGVDRIPVAYYRAKRQTEEIVARSGLPWTVQRATQFHSFLANTLATLARAPMLPVPKRFRFQPVDTAEVADRLCRHVTAGPAERAPDFGGPEVRSGVDLAHAWARLTASRRRIVAVPVPGNLARAYRAGANVCPDQPRGVRTWEEFLSSSNPDRSAHGPR